VVCVTSVWMVVCPTPEMAVAAAPVTVTGRVPSRVNVVPLDAIDPVSDVDEAVAVVLESLTGAVPFLILGITLL
jgi:hypothetical protein